MHVLRLLMLYYGQFGSLRGEDVDEWDEKWQEWSYYGHLDDDDPYSTTS